MFYKIVKAIIKGFLYVFFRVKIQGKENLPQNGSCLVCANHSSNWDAVFLLIFTKRKIHFMGKAEVFKNPILRFILNKFGAFPVQRGKADVGAVKKSMSILNNGDVLGMFPTGTRTNEEESADVKAGAALIGTRTGTTVVPVYIKSKYRLFSKVYITYGECIDLSEHKGKKLGQEELHTISEDIYHKIINLSK